MDHYRLYTAFILISSYLIVATPSDIGGNNKNSYYDVAKELGSFGAGAPIYGIYCYKDNVSIVRDSTEHVEIYEARRLHDWKGKLAVEGLKGPYDMVGNGASRSLFIMDWFDWANVTTVSTKAQNQVGRFSFDEPFTVVGLAATSKSADSDVVVTCTQTLKVKEFTKFGQLVRQVSLPPEITQPRHTIKLSSGNGYAVCHGYGPDEKHRVCILDNTGKILDCFGNVAGKGQSQLDVCARIAEDKNQNLLVADRNNKRVILLSNNNGKLKFEQEIIKEGVGLSGPTRIVIDDPILYVVDNTIDKDGMAVSGKVFTFRVTDDLPNF